MDNNQQVKKHHNKDKLRIILMQIQFRAKCRFRAIVRMVIANSYWLLEGVDQYEGDNVTRRVQQAMRTGKAKIQKMLLKIDDKALLNKPAEERTEEENHYIYRIIGGLKCFKRYPNAVKEKLAAVTYFKYYGPGRVIVRQHQDAHALYFIVTGDVIVSQLVFDELLQKFCNVVIYQMTVGDMFGEVSLLHNIPRTATCTTAGHCEFLILMKEDFKNVLQDSLQKQWDEIKLAMSAFTYFNDLDEVSRREACIVSKMKSYEENETILGDSAGVSNFIYFVLSGSCQMIETLQVLVSTHLGRTCYKLHDPYVEKVEAEPDFEMKYFQAYKSNHKETDNDHRNSDHPNVDSSIERHSSKATDNKSIDIEASKISEATERQPSKISKDSKSCEPKTQKKRVSIFSSKLEKPRLLRNSTSLKLNTIEEQTSSIGSNLTSQKLQTYFMQVCQFIPGATFGFGENMRDRRIVALTPVDCLLIPTVWLFQRNVTNIWTRVQRYLEKKIPTKKELFKEFVSQRRWHEFRTRVVADVVSRSRTVNYTTCHDVPYSVRLEEALDI